uniref:Large conductance mechanosensitive channel protein n=1 Tax=Spongospora subterranea TaxID=70186 RepID=A0A0H5RLZ5_9EUKA|eukprot:CRZ09754.1 hypothetical protein [Spongospora subterranea]
MGFMQDFKIFLSRGNVIDLAVGVVIGASFTAVVNAMVGDLFAPLIAILMPVSFENCFAQVKCPSEGSGWMPFNCKTSYSTLEAAKKEGAIVFAYGHFIEACLSFLLTSFVLFLIVRLYLRIHHKTITKQKKCDHCIQIVDPEATRCNHCSGALRPTQPDVKLI